MAPRKAASGAAKRQQPAPTPSRYGIQHFFSRHAANSQGAPVHQTAPAAPMRSAHAVPAFSRLDQSEGAIRPLGFPPPAKEHKQNIVQDRADCLRDNVTIVSPEANVGPNAPSDAQVHTPAPPGQTNAGTISPHSAEASKVQEIPRYLDLREKKSCQKQAEKNLLTSEIMPPPTAKNDGQSINDGSKRSPQRTKRPRYSPEMVVTQSQDDGGDEVVWKVSPTAERLLAAAKTEPPGGERHVLRPCNGRDTEGLLNKATSMAATSAASGNKKSPGIAGKLETWLSSPGTNKARNRGHTFKFSNTGNKENHPTVSQSDCNITGAGVQEDTARKQQMSDSSHYISCCSPLVNLQNPERHVKNGRKKHPHSGERRKALLDLLDKVVDAIVVQEQQPEGTPPGATNPISVPLKQSATASGSGNIRSITEDGSGLPIEQELRKSSLNSSLLSTAPAQLSGAVRNSDPSDHLLPATEYALPSALARVEPFATDCVPLCTLAEKPSPEKSRMWRESISNSPMEEKVRTCLDATDRISRNGHQDVESEMIDNGVKNNCQASIHFLVLEVADAVYEDEGTHGAKHQQKVLRLLNERSGLERVVYLRDAWFYSIVRPGDTVNIIGEFLEDGTCIIDTGNNLLVVHPDVLVSGTRVGASFSCPRRAVLDERIKSVDVSAAALMGTMLHQLFQVGLLAEVPSKGLLEAEAQVILLRHLDGLYAAGGSQTESYKKLVEAIPTILNWLQRFVSRKTHPISRTELNKGNARSVSISEVVDIEETIWSPKYGLKGMLDASVRVTGGLNGEPCILPLELKTGKGTTGMAAMEHRAQVFLYTLLMSDRYSEEVEGGLLYYMHTNETQGLQVQHADLVGLLMRRNEHANSIVSASATQLLPPMLQSIHMCRSCRHLDVCSIYHKVHEGGSSESSGLGALFDTRTDHLTAAYSEFLQLWDRLIDLEAQDMQMSHREIWRMNSKQREIQGRCLSSMVIDMAAGQFGAQLSKGDKYVYCFRRRGLNDCQNIVLEAGGSLLDRPFSCGDFVILSTESGHTAVAAGVITSINSNSLVLSLEHKLRLPTRPGVLESERLNQEIWRIDKDETASSIALMRYNLLQLFVKPSLNERQRQLIVDLEAPKFETGALTTQDPASIYIKGASAINDDQKRAIHKILSAKDYALVLGMPGTGKTSLIVHAVKALLSRGCSILLTSYTNSAVDNILLKLKAEDVEFLRVGRYDAIHPELQKHALSGPDVRVGSVEELDTKIQQARVVGATCLGITHALFAKRRFDVCIVDEAGQITLPVCLGPLRCADKFFLVGDHYQLPPLVRNPEARAKGMTISLFRRLCEAHPQSVCYLQNQYRMCGDIMALCNGLIYGNRLRCGSAEVANGQLVLHSYRDSYPQWLVQVLNPVRRVLFLDTVAGYGTDALSAEETRMRKALHNVAESSLVLKICQGLIGGGVAIQDIGVISPYNAQVDCIRRVASESGLSSLEVHTVDKYQGRDKECIVVSFVRSNASTGRANAGTLLTDWHRINVAITRAKKKLVMIGSQKTLSSTPLLSLLMRQVKELGGLVHLPSVIS